MSRWLGDEQRFDDVSAAEQRRFAKAPLRERVYPILRGGALPVGAGGLAGSVLGGAVPALLGVRHPVALGLSTGAGSALGASAALALAMRNARSAPRYWNDTHPEKTGAHAEVTFPATPMKAPNAPPRGAAGQFSGIGHAFDSAAKAVLKKYALLDDGNGADMLAKLFRRSNFGYGPSAPDRRSPRTSQDGGTRWSDASTGGADLGDAYGLGPSPMSGPV